MEFFNSKKFLIFVVILTTFLTYFNILQNEFVWDDKDFVLNWEETRNFNNIPAFFKGSVPFPHEGVYRPLRSIFYAFSYKMYGLDPLGYKIQAITIHLICAVLIFFIVLRIIKNRAISFMSSLLFAVHPVHTESITFTSASFDTIGIIFFFASFLAYLYARQNKTKLYYYVVSIILAILAFFTYEMTLVLPLIIVLYEFCFNKNGLIKNLKVSAPYFVFALTYLFIRIGILHIIGRGLYVGDSFYITMLTMAKVFFKYISIIILPINLNILPFVSEGISSLYITKQAALSQSVFDAQIIFSISALVCLAIIAIVNFRQHPIITFCICWFFICLSPVAYIIPQAALLSERYLYISSFGFTLLISFLMWHAYRVSFIKYRTNYIKLIFVVFFIFIFASFSILTYSRNKDWKNEMILWAKTTSQSPNHPIAHNNLGTVYKDAGQINLAVIEYKKAILINPKYAQAHYNLGYIYQIQKKFDLAIGEYKQSIIFNPNYAKARNNLGTVYYLKGELGLAIGEFQELLRINPDSAEAHNNIGIIYYKQKKIDLAILEYQKALKINSRFAKAHYNLGNAYYQKNEIALAILEYKKTLLIDPQYEKARRKLDKIGF